MVDPESRRASGAACGRVGRGMRRPTQSDPSLLCSRRNRRPRAILGETLVQAWIAALDQAGPPRSRACGRDASRARRRSGSHRHHCRRELPSVHDAVGWLCHVERSGRGDNLQLRPDQRDLPRQDLDRDAQPASRPGLDNIGLRVGPGTPFRERDARVAARACVLAGGALEPLPRAAVASAGAADAGGRPPRAGHAPAHDRHGLGRRGGVHGQPALPYVLDAAAPTTAADAGRRHLARVGQRRAGDDHRRRRATAPTA